MELLRAPADAPPRAAEEVSPAGEVAGERGRVLACHGCDHPVTTTAARIAVAGQHEHDGLNPHGFEYRFGCFSSAPGCRSRGVPSRQFTWFPGYFWHVQECEACGRHLGWLFFKGSEAFYGLILLRLVEREEPPAS